LAIEKILREPPNDDVRLHDRIDEPVSQSPRRPDTLKDLAPDWFTELLEMPRKVWNVVGFAREKTQRCADGRCREISKIIDFGQSATEQYLFVDVPRLRALRRLVVRRLALSE
jgi:hypothetical protein